MTLPATAARDAARGNHERYFALAAYMDLDRCRNVYGRAARNLLPAQSEQIAVAGGWTEVNVTVTENADNILAPDRNVAAEKLLVVSGIARAEVSPAIPARNTDYTFSTFAHAGNTNFVGLANLATTDAGIEVNLLDGSAVNLVNAPDAFTVERVDGGDGNWWRISITRRILTTDANNIWRILPLDGNGDLNGTANDYVYVWGAQLQLGTVLGPYIKVTGSAVSQGCRAGLIRSNTAQGGGANTITLDAGASAVDDFYNQDHVTIREGTDDQEEGAITDYVGATKVATVAALSQDSNWIFAPILATAFAIHDTDSATACYNTFKHCQDTPNYNRGVKTHKLITRGSQIPPGETVRPYITRFAGAPAVIDPANGLARRALLSLDMADEPDNDIEQDPYIRQRAQAAGATYWRRLIARNPFWFGRFVRVRKGYAVTPWDWDTFLDELYVIDSIAGPNERGIQARLQDPIKLADRNKMPPPTNGKLIKALQAVENAGTAQGGTANTIQLAATASAVDDFYNTPASSFEVKITENTGAGQSRVITDYLGATRQASVANWAVIPDTTSKYEVSALRLEMDAGKGAQYDKYTTPIYVRMRDEIIKATARSGDVLTWPDSSHRAQGGTSRGDHKVSDRVQLTRAYIDQPYSTVIHDIMNDAGIADASINVTDLVNEDNTWLGNNYRLTAFLSEPEAPSRYLQELAIEAGAVIWWSPTSQQVEFMVIAPSLASVPLWQDDGEIADIRVETLDKERITQAAINFARVSATANRREARNFTLGAKAIDAAAESANEHGDVRPLVRYSRFLGAANITAADAWVVRKVNELRDAPRKLSFQIDPKDYSVGVGQYIDVETSRLVDENGQPKRTRVLVTRMDDKGTHLDVQARTTLLGQNFGFIAPNGTADHPTETLHAHVAQNDGLMPNGDPGYLIF